VENDGQQVSRRGFFATAAAGTLTVWLATHARELEAAARLAATGGDEWMFLTADQAAVLDAVTAQIIPSDGTPGAREAKVVRFIDRSFATFAKDQRDDLNAALAELAQMTVQTVPGATSFASLTSEQQLTVLKAVEAKKDSYFGFFRFATIAGMFTMPSYGGNSQKMGWKMIGFDDRFAWTPPFGWYDRA
jgi:gluconate 2-dehydrogenase gamma chain